MKHILHILCIGLAPMTLLGQLLITEIADPVNNDLARFIEIYYRSANAVDLSDYKLVRWTNGNSTYTATTAIDLTDSGTLLPGSFLVIGANADAFNVSFGEQPDLAYGNNGPANSNGNYQIAILRGETIIDIFGVPGEDGVNTCHDFTDGRVERKPHVLKSNATFDESEWNVWGTGNPINCTSHLTASQTAPADFDPRSWIGQDLTTGDMTISNSVYFENLTLDANSTLTILKTGKLFINGLFNNQGSVIMDSDSNEFSAFITANIGGTGTFTYNRWAASINTNDLIAAPFAGQTFSDFLTHNSGIINTNPNDVTQNLFGNFNNNSGSYESFSSTSSITLDAGVGYRVGTDSGATLSFNGVFQTADQLIPISIGSDPTYGRWNLVGNPFPAYIELNTFFNSNSSVLDSNYASVYTYDGSGWTTYNNANSSGVLIAPGQGFFLASKTGGGDVSFTTAMQSVAYSDDFISGEVQQPDTYLKVVMSNGNDIFDIEIFLHANATLGMDIGFDAGLFVGQNPTQSIYSHLAYENTGLKLDIQSIPIEIDGTVVIPLGLEIQANSQVSIGLDSEVFLNNLHVYLEDTIANTWTYLNDQFYNFSPTTALQGSGRFYLHLSNQALDISSFKKNDFVLVSSAGQIIIYGNLKAGDQITIFNIQGQQLKQNIIAEHTNQSILSAHSFAPGIYIVHINSRQNLERYKILVK